MWFHVHFSHHFSAIKSCSTAPTQKGTWTKPKQLSPVSGPDQLIHICWQQIVVLLSWFLSLLATYLLNLQAKATQPTNPACDIKQWLSSPFGCFGMWMASRPSTHHPGVLRTGTGMGLHQMMPVQHLHHDKQRHTSVYISKWNILILIQLTANYIKKIKRPCGLSHKRRGIGTDFQNRAPGCKHSHDFSILLFVFHNPFQSRMIILNMTTIDPHSFHVFVKSFMCESLSGTLETSPLWWG